jgi:chromosome segregation ATPase
MNPTTSADALSQLESAQQSAQDPNAILQAQQNQLGVGQAQQTVQGLQGALNNTTKLLQQVAPSVMGRTQNSLVTQAQATKQIGNEQAPLNTTIGNETTQYDQANQDLTTKQQQAQTAASGIYTGQQDKLSYLQNIYNALYGQEKDQAAAAQKAAEDQAQQQQAAASLAEQAREANLSASTKTGSTGPNYATPTAPDIASIQNGLIHLSGSDGYVSPQTYQAAFNQWVSAGYDPNAFTKQFSKYKNPKNPNYSV